MASQGLSYKGSTLDVACYQAWCLAFSQRYKHLASRSTGPITTWRHGFVNS